MRPSTVTVRHIVAFVVTVVLTALSIAAIVVAQPGMAL